MADRRSQHIAFGSLALTAVGATGLLVGSHGALFATYYGRINPLVVVALATLLGAAALSVLRSLAAFEVYRGRETLRGVALAASLATAFGMAIIVADLVIRFPEEMNVPPPQALLFYPAVGFVVEILFHLLPLALLLLALRLLRGRSPAGVPVWTCIVLVALLEPTFQLSFEENPLSWSGAYVWAHIAGLNLVQLYLFRRFDFVTMYSFRLVYYLWWHIVWGVVRLHVLF